MKINNLYEPASRKLPGKESGAEYCLEVVAGGDGARSKRGPGSRAVSWDGAAVFSSEDCKKQACL